MWHGNGEHRSHYLQKSLKSLATRNTATLNRTHLIALAVHLVYHVSRFVLSARRRTLLPYILLTLPSLLIELFFESSARPSHNANGELQRAGDDLEAKGLTEWMWDIMYWTWGCIVFVAIVGNWGWWAWTIIPAYSAWLAFTTYSGMKSGLGGLMGGGDADGASASGGPSKRQTKMEKRGGQKMVYR